MSKSVKKIKYKKVNLRYEPFHFPCWIAFINGFLDSLLKNYYRHDFPPMVTSDFVDVRLKCLDLYCSRIQHRFSQYYAYAIQEGLKLCTEYKILEQSTPQDTISKERCRMRKNSLEVRIIEISAILEQAQKDVKALVESRKIIYEKQFSAYFNGFNRCKRNTVDKVDTRINATVKNLNPDVFEKVEKSCIDGSMTIIQCSKELRRD